MFSHTATHHTGRRGSIPANTQEISHGANGLVLVFVVTIFLAGAVPKCFAVASGADDGATPNGEARSAAVAALTISADTSAEPSITDDRSPLEESGAAPESAMIRFAPAIPDPPSILDSEPRALRPGVSRPCFPPPKNFCRALKDRRVVLLGGLQTAALISDGISTRQFLSHGYREVDPVAKIFIGSKPTWARMAPVGVAQVVVGMWLGEKMATSRHVWVRRFWWLPQTLGIAGNVAATVHNLPLHSSIAQVR